MMAGLEEGVHVTAQDYARQAAQSWFSPPTNFLEQESNRCFFFFFSSASSFLFLLLWDQAWATLQVTGTSWALSPLLGSWKGKEMYKSQGSWESEGHKHRRERITDMGETRCPPVVNQRRQVWAPEGEVIRAA